MELELTEVVTSDQRDSSVSMLIDTATTSTAKTNGRDISINVENVEYENNGGIEAQASTSANKNGHGILPSLISTANISQVILIHSGRVRLSKWALIRGIVPILRYRCRTRDNYLGWSVTMNRVGHFNTQLLDAIKNQNINDVQRLLNSGVDANATCRAGHISACHAAAFASADALQLLLKCRAIKDRKDKLGRMPLHLAAWAGNNWAIAMLLDLPIDLQNKVRVEVTPDAEAEIKMLWPRLKAIINVACNELVSEVTTLRQIWKDSIEHRCNKYMTHLPKFFDGWTPLHIASFAAHHGATRLLLAAGADVNVKDSMGQTPLDIAGTACYHDLTAVNVIEYVNTIKTLLEFGGKFNDLNITLSNTTLHAAVELCCVDAVQMLLDAGAPIWHRNLVGNTPLHECVAKRNKELLQILVTNKQLVDVENTCGYTVLHTAILASWVSGVCIALNAGADVTLEAHDGKTAIHIAALNGNLDILNECLRNAAQYPNFTRAVIENNRRTESPIFCAVRSGNIECVRAFLQVGVDLNMDYYVKPITGDTIELRTGWNRIPDQVDTSTPNMILHATAEAGSADMLELILHHDPKLEQLLCHKCPYLDQMIPVEFAAFHNRFETFRFLLCKTLERMQELQKTFDHSRLLYITRNKKTFFNELIKQIPNAVRTTNGYYPLHNAARNSDRDLIVQLIDIGGDLSERGEDGITAISLIIDNISKPSEFLTKIFDDFISTNKKSKECEITVNYEALLPTSTNNYEQMENDQMRVVIALLNTEDRQNQRKLLAHPLIESFLHLKWKTLAKYFYLMVCFYCLFVVSLSFHTGSVFYYKDTYNKTNQTMPENDIIPRFLNPNIWQNIMYIILGVVVTQELSCWNLTSKPWTMPISSIIEFWIKFITYSLAIATPLFISTDSDVIPGEIDSQRLLATVALMMAWLNIMMLLSKMPLTGYYIEMFLTVLLKVIAILFTFLFLILMFSLCFMIQFHSQAPFEDIWAAIAKTLVMMTSEFDYGDTFTRENAAKLSAPIQILRLVFLIFLILTAIVLMNLMLSVAIHDVQNLVKDGNLKRLEKQVAFLNRLEISRRRKTFIFCFFGLYWWIKSENVPKKVTFKPVKNDKCPFTPKIKEAIVNKEQEKFDRIEKEDESKKLELRLQKLQDVAEGLSRDVLSHVSELKSKLEHVQCSLNKLNDDTITNNTAQKKNQ